MSNPNDAYGVVYGLLDPDTKELRYIGITRRDIKYRLSEHINDADRGSTYPVHRWLRKLDKMPDICVLSVALSESDLLEDERYFVIRYKALKKKRLLNAIGGGLGSYDPSPETRLKMSLSTTGSKNPMYGRQHTESTKKKIALKAIGREVQTSTRDKISTSNKGKIRTEESKKRNSDAKLGDKNPNYRKQYTKEERDRISLQKRGDNHPNRKLSSVDVIDIRNLHATGISYANIAASYSVSYQTIYKVVNRTLWKHIK